MSENLPPAAAMDRRIERPRWGARRLGLIGLAVAAVAALGVVALELPPPGTLAVKASDLESAAAQSAPFQDYLPVRAEVAPLHTVVVTAVEGGQVRRVIAQDGTEVAQGAPLAVLDNPQLELDVTAKEAAIAGQLGQVSGEQLTLQRNGLDRQKEISETGYNLLKAQHELDIRRQLHDKGFVSDAGVKVYGDEADYYHDRLAALKTGERQATTISTAQAGEIRQTSARLTQNLSVVRASLDALVVRAPVAGRLTGFTLDPGQTLKAGDAVAHIDSEGAYKLVADVDEFYLGRVTPGQAATADLGGASQRVVVSRVLPQVTSGRFRAELTFPGRSPAGLHRGQSLDIRITLGDTRPALVLANGGWLEGGGGFAFVLTPDGRRADRRSLSVGRRNPEQVEITAGLRPAERVVTSSYAGFEKFNHLLLK